MTLPFEQVLAEESAVAHDYTCRRAALLLHSMSNTDRSWTLAQLEANQRARVEPLLEELVALGLPGETAWLSHLRRPTTKVRSSPSEFEARRTRIAAADPARVIDLLTNEPVALVRHVLRLGPWPWSTQVLSTLRARRGELFLVRGSNPIGDNTPTSKTGYVPATALDASLLCQLDTSLLSAQRLDARPVRSSWRAALQRGYDAVTRMRRPKAA